MLIQHTPVAAKFAVRADTWVSVRSGFLIVITALCLILQSQTTMANVSDVDTADTAYGTSNTAIRGLLRDARLQVAKGGLEEAGVTLERALRIQPDNPVLWNALARIRYRQGSYAEVSSLTARSASLAGANTTLRIRNRQLSFAARDAGQGNRKTIEDLDFETPDESILNDTRTAGGSVNSGAIAGVVQPAPQVLPSMQSQPRIQPPVPSIPQPQVMAPDVNGQANSGVVMAPPAPTPGVVLVNPSSVSNTGSVRGDTRMPVTQPERTAPQPVTSAGLLTSRSAASSTMEKEGVVLRPPIFRPQGSVVSGSITLRPRASRPPVTAMNYVKTYRPTRA